MKTIIGTLAVTSVLIAAAGAVVVYSGLINVAADEPHSAPVLTLLETARNRSIAVRSDTIDVPELDDAARIQAGSGNYAAMCASCHLAPGQASTEISMGLYPKAPDLTQAGLHDSPARTFWIIKHGIKATGMPAWVNSMDDQYIWDMVAFLQQLPSLDAKQYRSLVDASGGHQHGGGESGNHHTEPDVVHTAPAETPTKHIHADGKLHVHEH